MLTTVQLRSLKPQQKTTRLYDTGGLAGLYAEVSPTLKISFRLKYRFDGKEKRLNLGSFPAISISEARIRGGAAKQLLSEGIDPNEEMKRKVILATELKNASSQLPTLAFVIKTYIEKESINHKGHRWNEIRLLKFQRDFSLLCNKPILNLDPMDIIQWRDLRLSQVSSASVRRESNLLSSLFSYAVKELRLITQNPFRDVKKPKEAKARVRRISEAEIALICSICKYERGTTPQNKTQMVAWCFLFALETAMRASEITGMTWDHVFGEHVHLPDTKNDSSRDVPLLGTAVDLLNLMRGIDDVRVVTLNAATLSSLFRKVRDQTTLKDTDLHFHDARHEACTRLAQILPIQDLAKVSGHRDLKILLNTYYNITAPEIAEKMRQGQKRIADLT